MYAVIPLQLLVKLSQLANCFSQPDLPTSQISRISPFKKVFRSENYRLALSGEKQHHRK